MYSKVKILLTLICLVWPWFAWGGETYSLTKYGAYTFDNQHQWQIDHVLNLPHNRWFPIENEFSLGLITETVWLRFPIPTHVKFSIEGEAILELTNPLLNQLDIYLVKNGKVLANARQGDHLSIRDREIKVPDIYWLLPPHWREADQLYIRINTDSFFQSHFIIKDTSNTILEHGKRYWALGLFYGALGIMLLYNLLVFFQVKDIRYLYYSAYVFFIGSFHAVMDGLPYYFLSEYYAQFADRLSVYFVDIANIFALLFVTKFLEISDKRLLHGVRALILVFFLAMAIETLTQGHLSTTFTAVFSTVNAISISYITISAWLRGNEYARYLALAWIVLLISIPVYSLTQLGYLPTNSYTINSVRMGVTVEMALLSFSLAHRINLLRQEKLSLQRRLTQELGSLVAERTKELEAANKKLQELNETDALTQIRNRAYFNRIIVEETARAARTNTPLSILLADLDHFKSFNDQYGHNAGDECLRHFGKILTQQLVRQTDSACRYGGEEFIAILPDTDLEGALQVAERLRTAVENTQLILEGVAVKLTVSIGVYAAIPPNTWNGHDWVNKADKALYFAKTQRNRVAYLNEAGEPVFLEEN